MCCRLSSGPLTQSQVANNKQLVASTGHLLYWTTCAFLALQLYLRTLNAHRTTATGITSGNAPLKSGCLHAHYSGWTLHAEIQSGAISYPWKSRQLLSIVWPLVLPTLCKTYQERKVQASDIPSLPSHFAHLPESRLGAARQPQWSRPWQWKSCNRHPRHPPVILPCLAWIRSMHTMVFRSEGRVVKNIWPMSMTGTKGMLVSSDPE